MILITGGAGFIGSNFIRNFLKNNLDTKLVNIDKLTYAGNLSSLESIQNNNNYKFICSSIGDYKKVFSILKENKISKIINFAAESHVDNSISSPQEFIHTNIVGTYNLLEASR